MRIRRRMLFVLHEVTNATNTRETERASERERENFVYVCEWEREILRREKEKRAKDIFVFRKRPPLLSGASFVGMQLLNWQLQAWRDDSADINGDKEKHLGRYKENEESRERFVISLRQIIITISRTYFIGIYELLMERKSRK